jgi:hypothetical protein
MNFPKEAKRLKELLRQDQAEIRRSGRSFFEGIKISSQSSKIRIRADEVLEILKVIKAPFVSNIGNEGALAMSVLSTHAGLSATKKVLAAFEKCLRMNREDTYYRAIPAMIDWVRILERKPQLYGTIWLFDDNKQPYLPTVQDYENVNERRAGYDVGPIKWPRSLAIPEADQPWLKMPLEQAVMRNLSESEYLQLVA